MQQIFTDSDEGYSEICKALVKGFEGKSRSSLFKKIRLLEKLNNTTKSGIIDNQINHVSYYNDSHSPTTFPIRSFPGTFDTDIFYDINTSEFIRLSEECFATKETKFFQLGEESSYITVWPIIRVNWDNEIRIVAILLFGKEGILPKAERALFIISGVDNYENAN